MGPLIQMVALLAVVVSTSAIRYPCVSYGDLVECTGLGLDLPPPGYWPDVHTLDLRENAISYLPENSLSGFPKVTDFFLQNNTLTEVDFGVLVTLPKLNSLVIENNQIETFIPPADGLFSANLQEIYSNENNITKLDPDSFLFASDLFSLALNFNPLVIEAGQPIVNHPKLQTLYVGQGSDSFRVLDSNLFSGLPNLRRVFLSESQVTTINGAFTKNDRLEIIDLSYNSITQITSGSFSSAGAIEILYLNGNPLKRLDTAAVSHAMESGGTIFIDDTPLACECLYEALDWWASSKGVALSTTCKGESKCFFTDSLRSPAPPASPDSPKQVTKAEALGFYGRDNQLKTGDS